MFGGELFANLLLILLCRPSTQSSRMWLAKDITQEMEDDDLVCCLFMFVLKFKYRNVISYIVRIRHPSPWIPNFVRGRRQFLTSHRTRWQIARSVAYDIVSLCADTHTDEMEGNYSYTSSEGYDDFLKERGVPWIGRKLIIAAPAQLEVADLCFTDWQILCPFSDLQARRSLDHNL